MTLLYFELRMSWLQTILYQLKARVSNYCVSCVLWRMQRMLIYIFFGLIYGIRCITCLGQCEVAIGWVRICVGSSRVKLNWLSKIIGLWVWLSRVSDHLVLGHFGFSVVSSQVKLGIASFSVGSFQILNRIKLDHVSSDLLTDHFWF
jgi:hypothetical protein